jgi:hypothetical protein
MGVSSLAGGPINIFSIVRIKHGVVRANPGLSMILSHMARTIVCFILTIKKILRGLPARLGNPMYKKKKIIIR